MSDIKSTHDLLTEVQIPADERGRQRAKYCYLFRELADAADTGCFTGTDDAGTIDRLKTFEACFRLPFGILIPPALTMQLPAAYTYFGQFMNHDISAPIGGLLVDVDSIRPNGIIGDVDLPGLRKEWRANVDTILAHFENEHAAPLTLASLYGRGPKDHTRDEPTLYEADGRRFRLGKTEPEHDQAFLDQKIPLASVKHATGAPDILRVDKAPLIADQRNDGNLILCQLHLAFMLFHNKAVAAIEALDHPPADVFEAARQEVMLHYHWLILHDYLPNLLSKSVGRPLSDHVPRKTELNAVPMEFTTAAFRFGHSMVGRAYDFNANFGQDGSIEPTGATLADLFKFTSKGNMGKPGKGALLPDHWVIDWDRMTRPPQPEGDGTALDTGAEQIDLTFTPGMLDSAGNAQVAEHGSIMYRNLLRGFHRRMPFGQQLAEACNVKHLSRDEIREAFRQDTPPMDADHDVVTVAERLGLLDQTPAWLYMLCEAKVLEHGQRIGPTASKIIADTIIGLMRGNPDSALRHKGGAWRPEDSVLRSRDDKTIDSIRAFLIFATEDIQFA